MTKTFTLDFFKSFKIISPLLLLVISTFVLFSKNEANVWYFGRNAGLDFNTESPTVLTDSRIFAWEGCASICDTSGNLLFYTRGDTIFKRDHTIMANGMNILGNQDITQSSVIIPMPDNNHKYFLFTIYGFGISAQLRYSIIDITIDSVIVKNVFLRVGIAEKLAAVLHANGKDVWVMIHGMNNNDFYAYLVSGDSVALSPVISSVGSVNTPTTSIGYLKFSPNGHRLVSVNYLPSLELFDFNNSTGVVFNGFKLPVEIYPYGLSFSPDNSKLYVRFNHFSSIPKSKVYQFDLSKCDSAGIVNSRMVVGTSPQQIDAIQIGPDGKIYIAKAASKYLAVISYPNELGLACAFQDSAVYLGGQYSWNGLPNFIESYFNEEKFKDSMYIKGNSEICLEDSLIEYEYLLKGMPLANTCSWENISSSANMTNIQDTSVKITFNQEGTIILKAISVGSCRERDTVYMTIMVNKCDSDLVVQDTTVIDTTIVVDTTVIDSGFSEDSIIISDPIVYPQAIFIPNSFSPNDDGINDLLVLSNTTYHIIQFGIYDIKGKLIYSSDENYWNGKTIQNNNKVSPGVYLYNIQLSDHLGNPMNLKGNITVDY